MLLAVTKRVSTIETKHEGHFAYLQDGLFSFSEPLLSEQMLCLRSSAKPFQALACLNLLGSRLSLNPSQLALCLASHSGSYNHTARIKELLEGNAIDWQMLACGEHPPLDKNINYAINNPQERRLQNNCSGKHSLMLITCKLMGWDSANYLSSEHPLQQEILKTLAEMCEIPSDKVEVGIDGCGVPSFSLPISNVLIGFSKLNLASRNTHIRNIVSSILNEAFFVSGSERLDYELTVANKPKLVCKSGACGLTLVSFLDKPFSAFLLKMYDSDERVRAVVIKKLIENLGYKFESDSSLFSSELQNLHGQNTAAIQIFV